MLTNLLRNLISNTIKFTTENGRLGIHFEEHSTDTKLSIKGTGIGMSADNIATLFQIDAQFQTVGTKEVKGTSLGLLICKEFVDKHEG